MNLLKETKNRKEYYEKLLADLEAFMADTSIDKLSKDCLQGIRRDIDKYNHNVEYYDGIIKVLEENN